MSDTQGKPPKNNAEQLAAMRSGKLTPTPILHLNLHGQHLTMHKSALASPTLPLVHGLGVRPMKTILLTGFIVLSLGTLVHPGPAAATPITYSWTGIVNRVDPGVDPGVSVGQTIGISLTLDNTVSDDDPSSNSGSYSATPATPPLVLGVDIGGDTNMGPFQSVTVLNDVGGVDSIEISSSSIMTELGFDILFQTNNLEALGSDAIPFSINPGDFQTATFSVDRGVPFSMFLPSFGGTIGAAAVPVPEPGSLAVLVSGLLALAGIRGRRRSNTPGRKNSPAPL
jgi:hypothetical protein